MEYGDLGRVAQMLLYGGSGETHPSCSADRYNLVFDGPDRRRCEHDSPLVNRTGPTVATMVTSCTCGVGGVVVWTRTWNFDTVPSMLDDVDRTMDIGPTTA